MKTRKLIHVAVATGCTMMTLSCAQQTQTAKAELTTVGNPYLPLWEHVPDGEPYVFEDPDQPGKQRVYILWFARQHQDCLLRTRPGGMVGIGRQSE